MTEDQKIICLAFGNIRFLPGSFDKRFARNMNSAVFYNPALELTERQNEWIYMILYKYRKQIPATYQKYQGHEFCNIKKNLK